MGTSTRKKEKIKYLLRHIHLLGILTIIFCWFIFASPYFLKQLVPFPTTQLVSASPPWNLDSKYAIPVKNSAMPDLITQIYPWKHFVVSELKSGKLPVWNPYNFSGSPLLANFQSAVFSPFTLLYMILPFIDAWSLVVLLQPLLAGLFTYLFLRECRVSVIGSLISSISFMFCGFMTVWMAYGTLSMAIAFLPLALFSIESYWKTNRMKWQIILVLSLITSIFSGHFQTSLYLLITVAGFVIYKFISTKDLRKTLSTTVAMTFGLVLTLPQLIPTAQLYGESVRSSDSIVDKGIPWYYLVTAFAPDFFGNPVTHNDWLGFYAERASFIGIIPLLLAGCSLFIYKKNYLSFFIVVGTISLLFSLDTPLQILLAKSGIPVLSSSNPTRLIVIWSFSSSVLAGFGFDQLKNMLLNKSPKILTIMLFLSLLFMGGIFLVSRSSLLIPEDKIGIVQHNIILPLLIFFLTFCSIGISIYRPSKQIVLYLSLILLSLTFLDSYRFIYKWMPFESRNYLFPDLPVISELQRLPKTERVFGTLGAQVHTYYEIPTVDGYDPLYLRRYGEFISAAATGHYAEPERSSVQLDRQSPNIDRVLDFLSVGYIYHPKSHSYQSWAYPVWGKPDRYSVVYEDDKFLIFRNTKMLPRARLYYDYQVIQEGRELLSKFYKNDFSYNKTLLLEKDPNITIDKQIASGSAKIISLTPSRISVRVDSTSDGFLFLADPYYPNWEAKINGVTTTILRADYAFRAVKIPKGKSEVIFTYRFF